MKRNDWLDKETIDDLGHTFSVLDLNDAAHWPNYFHPNIGKLIEMARAALVPAKPCHHLDILREIIRNCECFETSSGMCDDCQTADGFRKPCGPVDCQHRELLREMLKDGVCVHEGTENGDGGCTLCERASASITDPCSTPGDVEWVRVMTSESVGGPNEEWVITRSYMQEHGPVMLEVCDGAFRLSRRSKSGDQR